MVAGPQVNAAATALLARCRQVFVDLSRPVQGHVVVANGAVVYECELLAVQVVNVLPGVPGSPHQGPLHTDQPWYARIAIHSTRCAPVGEDGEPISAADVSASAAEIQADCSAILEACRQHGQHCNSVQVLGVQFPGPTDFAAVVVSADVQL